MKASRVNTLSHGAVIVMVAILGLAVAPTTADAQTGTALSNPCPYYSIQDIFDDPASDWDRDRVPNGVELDHGEDPCMPVHSEFCAQQPSLCTFTYLPVSRTCSRGTYWNWAEVNHDPNTDWDGDGITNITEAKNGANPCAHPCPTPTAVDLSLSPNGDWDRDGIRNRNEVVNNTDPCVRTRGPRYVFRPAVGPGSTCPFGYPYYVVATGLCYQTPQHVPRPAPISAPATPPPGFTCPPGFPYYNVTTRLCYNYAQPVVRPAPVIAPATPPPGFMCPAGFPYYKASTRLCHARPF